MQTFFDSHIHTRHSSDSRQPMPPIFQAALEKGLWGLAITDHADILWAVEKDRILAELRASIEETRMAALEYAGRLEILCGVELADPQDDPELTRHVLGLTDYDLVLGSIHCASDPEWGGRFYSEIPFDRAPEEALTRFLGFYFQKVLSMAERDDFDVLAHLTCPLRYLNGTYHRNVTVSAHTELIRAILDAIIRRDKALEINTSGLNSFYGALMPDWELIQQFYDMGGRRITLGSDAHTAGRVGNSFSETAARLREMGFRGYSCYRKRTPQLIPWDG